MAGRRGAPYGFCTGAINSLPIYLLVFLPLLFRWLQHYKKSVALLVKRGKKAIRPIVCGVVLFKRVVLFFFFVKILTIKAGYTRMCLLYKNAYKRLFCLNIKTLKGGKNERVY